MGCKLFGTAPCSNRPNEGEIHVNPLKGKLGYINKANKEVGVLLEPAEKKGEFAKFDLRRHHQHGRRCRGNTKRRRLLQPETTGGYDGIISPITPVNTMTANSTQVFTINEATRRKHSEQIRRQTHRVARNRIIEKNNELQFAQLWSPAGETITNVNTSETEGEIKA